MVEAEDGSELLDDRIVDAAVAEAEESGSWYDLRLSMVARRLDMPLDAVLARFRDADAIADAWFARALRAMLREPDPGFLSLPPSMRVETVLMRWLDAQMAHRRVVAGMLQAKLHPSHPHHWVPMIFSLSRLIHWMLEAARLDARGLPRQAEEVGLTLLFVRTLRLWLRDADPDRRRTRTFLRRNLAWLDRLPRRSRSGAAQAAGHGRAEGSFTVPETSRRRTRDALSQSRAGEAARQMP